MKKLRYLLSAFLLVVGLSSASAQYYSADDGADQSDESLIYNGAEVGFYHAGNGEGGTNGGFLNGEKSLSQNLTVDGVYIIEDAGRESEDGFPLYLLKQKSTGKYIRQSKFEEMDYSAGGNSIEYRLTDTLDLALGFVFQIAADVTVEDTAGVTPRAFANPAKQNLDDYAWTISSEHILKSWKDINYIVHDTLIYTYLGAVGGPMLSSWIDTNCWWIYPATEAVGEELILAAFPDLTINPADLSSGIDPGCYGQAEIDAYKALYDQMEEQAQNYTLTDEEAEQLVKDALAALEALKASFVQITPGNYYMIKNLRSNKYAYNTVAGEVLYQGNPADAENINVDDVAYYWYVEAGNSDSTFHVKNFATEKYVAGEDADLHVVVSATPAEIEIIEQPHWPGSFQIRHLNFPEESTNYGWWNDYAHQANSPVGVWGGITENGNSWVITTAPAAKVEALKDAAKQKELNETLTELVADADGLIASSKKFKPSADCTLDADLSAMGLVTSVDQLSSNADHNAFNPNSHDGKGLPGLLDDSVKTYFHSAWQNGPSEVHYIDAQLNQAIDGLSLKLARRIHGNQAPAPAKFTVYTMKADSSWVLQGALTVNYAYDVTYTPHDTVLALYPDSVIVGKNYVGVGALPFDGSYDYVRLAVPAENTQGGTNNYFYLSELRYFAGAAYDAENSPYEQAPAELRTAFETALAQAQAELAAEKATQATIDALEAAYDALAPKVPSTAYLLSLIDDYSTLVEGAAEGEGLGFFTAGSKEVFKAVIDTIANTVNDKWTIDEIAAAEAEIKAAYAAFMACYQIPEAGKLYTIRAASRKLDSGGSINKVGNYYTARSLGQRGYCYGYNNGEVGSDPEAGTDTIDITTSYNSLWTFEYPVEGNVDTVYIRSAATGLYVGEGGFLSVEPFKIHMKKFAVTGDQVWGNNNFLFDVGNTYMNVDYRLDVLVWADANDVNAAFRVEEVTDASGEMLVSVAEGPQILTLPYTIDSYSDCGYMYEVVGYYVEGTDSLLALNEIQDDAIEAGKPFIYILDEGASTDVYFTLTDAEGNEVIVPEIGTEAQEAYGMVGALSAVTVPDSVAASAAEVRDGQAYILQRGKTFYSGSGYINIRGLQEVDAADELLMIAGSIANSIEGVITEEAVVKSTAVYTIDGRYVGKSVKALPAGIYVVAGKKVLVK